MSSDPSDDLPPHGRLVAAGMAVASAVGLAVNHFAVQAQGIGGLFILCLGPLAFFLGIGGVVEPKVVWAVGKYGKDLPAVYKIVGGTLAAVGVAVTILLLVFVYRLGPPGG